MAAAGPQNGRQYMRCARPPGHKCSYFRLLNNESRPPFFRRPATASNGDLPNASRLSSASTVSRPSSSGSNVSVPHDDDQQVAPNCKCSLPSVKRVVRKTGPNQGKHFFVCAKQQGQQCGFFEWAHALAKHDLSAQAKRPLQNVVDNDQAHVAKRPRVPPRNTLKLALLDVDSLKFTMHVSTTWELRKSVKDFQDAKVTPTNILGKENVVLPMDALANFRTHVASHANTTVAFDFPPSLLARVAEFKRQEKSREEGGDVVTTSLNEILPPVICEKLMDFQWEGVHFALKRGGRCLIGDDMGLGKTLQAIAVARIYKTDWPLLIVCPSSLRLNWKEEILRWLADDVCESDIHVMMSGKDIDRPLALVNILSYDLVWKVPPQFLKRCNVVISDESHYLKSMAAKRSKAMTPLIKKSKRALLLSGTPALSRPVELFPQINALTPVLFPNYGEFVERYCAAHQGRFGYDVSGASHLDELHTLLSSSVLIRRKKEDVLTQLPEKQRQVLWVETKPQLMKRVDKALKEYEKAKERLDSSESEAQGAVAANAVKAAQNALYTVTGLAKLDSVKEFCKDTAESGCKFIVFLHHAEMMDKLDDYLTGKLKLGIIRIDGSTPQGSRQALCHKFQEDPKCRVALLSITAAGVGLTLTSATVVLFAELYWNPGSLLQAEDRAHRIGQRDCVIVKYLLAKKTIDESMWSTVRRKLNVVGQSLTGTAARMELVDGKSNTEEIEPVGDENTIDRFFKPRANSKVSREPTCSDADVIDLDDIQPPDPPDEAVLLDDEGAPQAKDNTSSEELLPTSLTAQEPHAPMSPSTEKQDTIPDLPTDMDFVACHRRQQQMDSDVALARRLQAHFDTESGR